LGALTVLGHPRGREELFSLPDEEPEREESGARLKYLAAAYHLDESDPDIAILRRRDGTFVAAFSSLGATREGIVEAAREDYRRSLLRRQTSEGAEDLERDA
jgi:hypothetical protein